MIECGLGECRGDWWGRIAIGELTEVLVDGEWMTAGEWGVVPPIPG